MAKQEETETKNIADGAEIIVNAIKCVDKSLSILCIYVSVALPESILENIRARMNTNYRDP
ncbi:uncharacterized protein LOC143906577 isoform X2 [Temnothorax americanus]|uniref:uncharacterized protein LOC143906577 isoform X2 n=1 Tax=Temnothorax americanus TaxID=1964332 RepID=UPI004068AAAE